jgi:hypothetical protein
MRTAGGRGKSIGQNALPTASAWRAAHSGPASDDQPRTGRSPDKRNLGQRTGAVCGLPNFGLPNCLIRRSGFIRPGNPMAPMSVPARGILDEHLTRNRRAVGAGHVCDAQALQQCSPANRRVPCMGLPLLQMVQKRAFTPPALQTVLAHGKQQEGEVMGLGTILLIVLILILLGVIPTWPHSRSWGYAPSGVVGVVVIIIIVLLLTGRL